MISTASGWTRSACRSRPGRKPPQEGDASRVVVVAAGKMKEKAGRALCDEYLARIRRYVPCDEIEVRDEDPSSPAAAQRVATSFGRAIPERARTIALEVDGDAMTSERFATLVGRTRDGGASAMVFLIGGAYGLPSALSKSADVRLSLGAMTLPHRLARIVLAEQIYRAFTILAGEPYHHAG